MNITGFQSRLIYGINLNLEFLRDPIHAALVLSTLMFRTDIEANCCKTDRHEQNDSLVPSRKKVASFVNCDNNISSSRMFIPCMVSFCGITEANSSAQLRTSFHVKPLRILSIHMYI